MPTNNVSKSLSDTAWVYKPKPLKNKEINLFCFAFAGGSAFYYRPWSNCFNSIEICAVQLPGRANRIKEQAIIGISEIADHFIDALTSDLDTPFAFFGHSMGAILAYEVSIKLEQRKLPTPKHLFLSARSAPHITSKRPKIAHLPKSEFLKSIIALQGTPIEVAENAELMDLVEPSLRADFLSLETYVATPAKPRPIPITVFGGIEDPWITADNLNGWQHYTSSSFDSYQFSGGHFFLDQHYQQIATIIKQSINAVAPAAKVLCH